MRNASGWLAWCVVLSGVTALALPPAFTSMPQVVVVAGRQVQVSWRTSVDATSEIGWGPASTSGFDLYPARSSPTAVPGYSHSRTLRHLPPGTWFLRVRSTNGPDRLDSSELMVTVPSSEQWPRADVAVDGTVNAIVTWPGVAHLGGSFTRAYSNVVGAGVLLDPATGLTVTDQFPEVAGEVLAASRDTANRRLYACGSFSHVGGAAHAGVVRYLVDGNVDPSFSVQVSGAVRDCAVEGTTLYLVGAFSSVNGQARGNGAAIDLTTDTLLPWNPQLNAQGTQVEAGAGRVFVAGDFTLVGTTPRLRVAGVDPVSGVATGFVADADGAVRTMLLDGMMMLGGAFDTINGTMRPRLAQVDPATGALTAFDAQVVGTEVLAVTKNTGLPLYFGGRLTSVRGVAVSYLAAVNPMTGVASTEPVVVPNNTVTALAFSGPSTVCLGGTFSFLDSSTRRGAGCFDALTGALTGFHPDLSGPARTIVPIEAGGALYVGGSFAAMKPGTAMSRYLRLDTVDGGATAGPSFSGTVFALAPGRDVLYAGGFFTTVGGQPRANLAAIDVGMNAITPWNPSADQSVHALEVFDSALYVGGDFSMLGGQARAWAGALSPDGGLLPFAPVLDNSVESLTVAHGNVYLGGTFTMVNGSARSRLVAVEPQTGATNALFTPAANGTVYALSAVSNLIYVGGSFSTIGGVARGGGAAFKPEGAIQSWNPSANGAVRTVKPLVGGTYVGGDFSSPVRAAMPTDVGGALVSDEFRISEPGVVRTLAWDCGPAQALLVGGSFFNMGPAPVQGVAVLDGRAVCARLFDAGVPDAGLPDAGVPDAGAPDAGDPDAGLDAGADDAGLVDAGDTDAGVLDAGDGDAGFDGGQVVDDAGVEGDGGRGRYVLPVGCGCSSGVEVVALLAMALVRRRRR